MADDIAEAHRELALESIHSRDAWQLLKAINWILSQPRTIRERLDALAKLTSLPPGPRIIRMSQLTGWKN